MGTATAVVGGIALLTKLGVDEMQHRNIKAKTNPANSYSAIRILPDLVTFEGFIRIHRVRGDIVCPVPIATKEPENENGNGNSVAPRDSDSVDAENEAIEAKPAAPEQKEETEDAMAVEVKWLDATPQNPSHAKSSSWFDSLSRFASSAAKSVSKLQSKLEAQNTVFDSDFPRALCDAAILRADLETYAVQPHTLGKLFEQLHAFKLKEPSSAESNELVGLSFNHETLFFASRGIGSFCRCAQSN